MRSEKASGRLVFGRLGAAEGVFPRWTRGIVAACAALMACGDETGTSSGTTTQSGSSSGGAGGSGGDGMGGAGGGGGGSAGTCPAETICLALKPTEGGPVEAGRVVVVWYQINDDGPDPRPLIAYDQPFDPNVDIVEIPIAGIGLPNPEHMLCNRMCDDEAMCPCLDDVKVGYMGMGYSVEERVPAPAPLDALFPGGIDKGVRPYRIIEAGTREVCSMAPIRKNLRTTPIVVYALCSLTPKASHDRA